MVLHTITPRPRHLKALTNWTSLNDLLRTGNLDDCRLLLRLEQGGKKRMAYLRRITQRYTRTRKILEARKCSR